MTLTARSFLPFLVLLLGACRSSAPAASSKGAAAPAAAGAEKFGVLAPLDGTPLSLWPEAYGGAWLVLEVLPQGAEVKEGDVVARLDARSIDEELHRAELELATATLAHRALAERNGLETRAAESALARARAALARSQRALRGWNEGELAFARRGDELSQRYEQANVEDQTDELDQLQKMYQGDELVDATEDIVIKRSQRALALTKSQNELSRDRARQRFELDLALQSEQRTEAVRSEEEALARLAAEQALAAAARADAELRSADALARQGEELARLRRDRAFFELRAPRAGVLLHGDPRDYRPGQSPARHARGTQLAARSEIFVVAPAAPGALAFEVGDGERERFADGATIEVEFGGQRVPARVELDEYPRTLGVGETTLRATATLAQPLPGARHGQRVRVHAKDGR